jgi:beta-mannosidase
VELAQEPLPWTQAVNSSLGPSRAFYFRVNGLPVYAKGANNIPSDQFESRVTPELLWDYLSSAKDAHFNMLRVWGGGLYERDEFFEYCDQLGIMIYRASHTAVPPRIVYTFVRVSVHLYVRVYRCVTDDMMFSDQIYPWHQEFLASVAAETTYQVRRLSYHPSLVLWSGTNELLPGAVTNLAPFTGDGEEYHTFVALSCIVSPLHFYL